eukprot:1157854-Pelagomonas_calceolata.AAC.3
MVGWGSCKVGAWAENRAAFGRVCVYVCLCGGGQMSRNVAAAWQQSECARGWQQIEPVCAKVATERTSVHEGGNRNNKYAQGWQQNECVRGWQQN